MQGIEHWLRRRELLCLVAQMPPDPKEREALVATLAGRQVSGLIVLAAESDDPMLEMARQRELPTILVNRGAGNRNFSAVVNDDRGSVRLVLEHLASLGHKRIAHIAGPQTSSTGHARRLAFTEIAREMGFSAAIVYEATAFTREAGMAATERLLAHKEQVTAIFSANDLLALGTLDVLRARNLRVPDDISLVGHNDMPLVDLIDPPLTTVRIALREMSEQAASLFIERLDAPDAVITTRMLMPTLIVRKSTAVPLTQRV